MNNWDIYGISQADAIKYFKNSDGKEYIITANEGDPKVRSTKFRFKYEMSLSCNVPNLIYLCINVNLYDKFHSTLIFL